MKIRVIEGYIYLDYFYTPREYGLKIYSSDWTWVGVMKKPVAITLMLICLMAGLWGVNPGKRQIKNLEAFTKLYGYIRYYYPSDEAQAVDWDKFSVFGAEQVTRAKNDIELLQILNELFLPVAPLLKIATKDDLIIPVISDITPSDAFDWNTTCWQYEGLRDNPRSSYNSKRTNRPIKIKVNPRSEDLLSVINFDFSSTHQDCQEYRLSYSIQKVDSDTTQGHIWTTSEWGGEYEDSLATNEWKRITHTFQRKAEIPFYISVIYLLGMKQVNLDSLSVEGRIGSEWVLVYDNDFENDRVGWAPSHLNLDVFAKGLNDASYNEYKVLEKNGNRSLNITMSHTGNGYTTGYNTQFIPYEVPIGTFVNKRLTAGLYCRFPLSLYCNALQTYPAADSVKLRQLIQKTAVQDISDLGQAPVRLGSIVVYWNIMQHFYPYWKYATEDWNQCLRTALGETLMPQDTLAYKLTMYKMISATRDGHRSFVKGNRYLMLPGFMAEKIENKWIVTQIQGMDINLPVGSEITRINGRNFARFMAEQQQYYLFASEQFMNKRIFRDVMIDYPDSGAVFSFKTPGGEKVTQYIKKRYVKPSIQFAPEEKTREYTDGIYYINVNEGKISDKQFNAMLPQLQKAKALIIDWRGNPTLGTSLISSLLTCPDTTYSWNPGYYLYPDQEKVTYTKGFRPLWMLQPREPHLDAKVIFLCEAGNLSYEESYLEYIQNYKLGIVIGEPTGGTTGNVAYHTLPGGYKFSFTGMYVDKPDGSRFHGVGIIPDITVKRTRMGIAAGKDETLDAALKYLQAELSLADFPQAAK